MKSIKIKYNLYFLLVLSSLTFYNPFGIISPQLGKLIYYSICIISLIYAYKIGINLKKIKYPKVAYKILICGIIFSSFMATFFHEQSFKTSFIAIIPYLFGYLVFYILMKFNIPKEKIEKAIWVFCFISMGIYIINMITFPNIIFGTGKDEYDMSRGIVRLGVYSIEFIVLFFFYSINQWLLTKQKKYVWLILLTSTFIVLSVTRQIILLSAVLGIFFILRQASLQKKIVVISCCILFYFAILPQIPMYKTMVELSEQQIERNNTENEDIRITAWKFYTYEYQVNVITSIFGNGVPSLGNSQWAKQYEKMVYSDYGGNGCYYVDVGWAGFFGLYGMFGTLGLLILLIKAMLKKKSEEMKYVSYWLVFIIITSITSAPIIFYNQVISITTILYLIYGKNKLYRNNNSQLQQQYRYNKLH